MSIRRGCSILVLILACTTIPSAATSQTALCPGSRVRVVETRHRVPQVTGELVRLSGDTAVVRSGDGSASSIVVTPGLRLETVGGRRRLWGEGLVAGYLGGFAAGAVYASVTGASTDPGLFGSEADWLMAGSALAGTLLGVVVGSQIRTVAWRHVETGDLRVDGVPARYDRWSVGSSAASLCPGARVRVTDVANRTPRVTGRLISVDDDTLVIMTSDSATFSFVSAPGLQLQVSGRRRGRARQGAGYGFLVFGLVAGLTGAPMEAAIVAGLSGAMYGAIIGSLLWHEVWQPAEPRRVGLWVAPAGSRGWLVGASSNF